MEKTEVAATSSGMRGIGAVALSFVASVTLVAVTHGVRSDYLFLLFLPLVLAVIACSPFCIVTTGVLLAIANFVVENYFTYPALSPHFPVREMSVIGLAVVGAFYATRMRAHHVAQSFTPSEREGLLGLAYTDPMTGLYNFRKFRDHLEEELRRAARYGHSLSLILIDLDAFKAINDRYGHPAGDRVLTGVAAIIRDTVRTTDLPARYGGEEFVIVCPETDAVEAMHVAERIRAAMEAASAELVPGETGCLTCSAGIASFPEHARDEVGLIEAADAALYHAKGQGKNRVASPLSSSTKT